MAGDPVEQAYREGKFPAARRAFWHKRMAKRPKATRRELGEMAAMLPPPEDQAVLDEFAEEQSHAAPVAAAPSGPKKYPKEWLDRGQVVSNPVGDGGTIVQEPGVSGAPATAGPGEVL